MTTRNSSVFLSKQQIGWIWNAASFGIQEFGKPLNVAFVMTAPAPLKATSGKFIHCLEQRLHYWSPSTVGILPWISVQSRHGISDYSAVCAFHVPIPLLSRVIEWFDGHRSGYSSISSMTAQWPTNGRPPVKEHFDVLSLCCQSTNPEIWVRVAEESRRLLDIVAPSPRPRLNYLPLEGRRIEMASCIGRRGQKRAADDGMAMISAFDDGAFAHLRTGWEIQEHDDRVLERRERSQREALLLQKWPPGENRLFDAKRAEELEKLKKRDPRVRKRSWEPWWLTRTEITSNLNRKIGSERRMQDLDNRIHLKIKKNGSGPGQTRRFDPS